MTVFVVVVGLLMAWRAVAWVRAGERRPADARGGGYDPVAHLDVGVVLQLGEKPWAKAQPGARLATWEAQVVQVAASRTRCGGRRVDGAVRR